MILRLLSSASTVPAVQLPETGAAGWVAKLTEADLSKPTPKFLQKFVPTVGNVAIHLAAQPYMHFHQF